MNKTVNSLVWAVTGACLGASATYMYVKKKYEIVLEKELANMRESFERTKTELVSKNEEEKKRILDTFEQKLVEKYSAETEDAPADLVEPDDVEVDSDGVVLSQVSRSYNDPEYIDASENGSEEDYGLVDIYYDSIDGQFYYDEDHVDPLADGEELELFGEDVVDTLPDAFKNKDVVYVRNYQKHNDYTILLQ